jgi:hypothetical protein
MADLADGQDGQDSLESSENGSAADTTSMGKVVGSAAKVALVGSVAGSAAGMASTAALAVSMMCGVPQEAVAYSHAHSHVQTHTTSYIPTAYHHHAHANAAPGKEEDGQTGLDYEKSAMDVETVSASAGGGVFPESVSIKKGADHPRVSKAARDNLVQQVGIIISQDENYDCGEDTSPSIPAIFAISPIANEEDGQGGLETHARNSLASNSTFIGKAAASTALAASLLYGAPLEAMAMPGSVMSMGHSMPILGRTAPKDSATNAAGMLREKLADSVLEDKTDELPEAALKDKAKDLSIDAQTDKLL